mmetsp:Transcript_60900/g.133912  ORF Transcript_60900/g.133912 Transcript_60900/m.133912 type:complete len:515 (+) Transcript_60900:111-1655(+)
MDAEPPLTVLVINNNPDSAPGHYTQLIIGHLREAGVVLHEARTVEAVDAYADSVVQGGSDVGLIITCGSPVVLTEPVDMSAHVTKTTAAMLHFPNAPVVGICFGMQLLAQLYGGTLTESRGAHAIGGEWAEMVLVEGGTPARLLEGLEDRFVQWATNFIFLERAPPRFVVTAKDAFGRVMAMEHTREHVYGVQWHPEVVHEVTGRRVLDNIIALIGQNRRRIAPRQCWEPAVASPGVARVGAAAGAVSSSAPAWCCSKHCRLRLAVKEATKGDGEPPFGECSCRDGANLGERLAAARREALATLQRDHCRGGGITMAALEDAISTLRQIADAGPSEGKAAPRPASEGEELVCTPHDADLRLREAVRGVLQSERAASMKAGSSRASSCSTRTSTTAITAVVSATASTDTPTIRVAGDAEAQDAARDLGPAAQVDATFGRMSMHEADLRLRAAVKEALFQESNSGPHLGRRLAFARRDALLLLRQRGTGADGSVALEAVEAAVAALRRVPLDLPQR